jgi:hypothetical protein
MKVWVESAARKLRASTTERDFSTTRVRVARYDPSAQRGSLVCNPAPVRSQASICPSPGIRE